MVLKGIRGEVRLALKIREEEPYGEILINRGGQMWKRLGWAYKPATLFRLEPSVQTLLNDERRFEEMRQMFNANAVMLSSSSSVQQFRGGWQVIDPMLQRVYRIQSGPGRLDVFEGTLVGLLRLVYLPDLDNQTAAVEIRMEGLTGFQKIDPFPEAQSLRIPISGWQDQPLVLETLSHARGTLSIANVVQECVWGTESAPARSGTQIRSSRKGDRNGDHA